MISMDKSGGRTIHLFIPFEYKGKKVESIVLQPLRFGHVLRWAKGDWPGALEFMTELAGVDEAVMRDLRYPDADRVMESFMNMLPNDIRNDITEGRIPHKVDDEAEAPTQETAPVTNGGAGEPLHPALAALGVPLPEAGFDMSDDPPPPEAR